MKNGRENGRGGEQCVQCVQDVKLSLKFRGRHFSVYYCAPVAQFSTLQQKYRYHFVFSLV